MPRLALGVPRLACPAVPCNRAPGALLIMEATTAYIGLGSNVGEREQTIRNALEALGKREGIVVTAVSRLIETAPVGGPPQEKYLNGVAEMRTTLSPQHLMQTLLQTEDEFGRVRAERWGPRTLDLDLLLYGDAVVETPDLQIPHPRMHERLFVLAPLCDIAPEAIHPVLRMTAAELLAQLQHCRTSCAIHDSGIDTTGRSA